MFRSSGHLQDPTVYHVHGWDGQRCQMQWHLTCRFQVVFTNSSHATAPQPVWGSLGLSFLLGWKTNKPKKIAKAHSVSPGLVKTQCLLVETHFHWLKVRSNLEGCRMFADLPMCLTNVFVLKRWWLLLELCWFKPCFRGWTLSLLELPRT